MIFRNAHRFRHTGFIAAIAVAAMTSAACGGDSTVSPPEPLPVTPTTGDQTATYSTVDAPHPCDSEEAPIQDGGYCQIGGQWYADAGAGFWIESDGPPTTTTFQIEAETGKAADAQSEEGAAVEIPFEHVVEPPDTTTTTAPPHTDDEEAAAPEPETDQPDTTEEETGTPAESEPAAPTDVETTVVESETPVDESGTTTEESAPEPESEPTTSTTAPPTTSTPPTTTTTAPEPEPESWLPPLTGRRVELVENPDEPFKNSAGEEVILSHPVHIAVGDVSGFPPEPYDWLFDIVWIRLDDTPDPGTVRCSGDSGDHYNDDGSFNWDVCWKVPVGDRWQLWACPVEQTPLSGTDSRGFEAWRDDDGRFRVGAPKGVRPEC